MSRPVLIWGLYIGIAFFGLADHLGPEKNSSVEVTIIPTPLILSKNKLTRNFILCVFVVKLA
jgi:hypothetical protein